MHCWLSQVCRLLISGPTYAKAHNSGVFFCPTRTGSPSSGLSGLTASQSRPLYLEVVSRDGQAHLGLILCSRQDLSLSAAYPIHHTRLHDGIDHTSHTPALGKTVWDDPSSHSDRTPSLSSSAPCHVQVCHSSHNLIPSAGSPSAATLDLNACSRSVHLDAILQLP
jgi:hypothetical protein